MIGSPQPDSQLNPNFGPRDEVGNVSDNTFRWRRMVHWESLQINITILVSELNVWAKIWVFSNRDVRKWDHSYNDDKKNWVSHIFFLRKRGLIVYLAALKGGYSARTSVLCHIPEIMLLQNYCRSTWSWNVLWNMHVYTIVTIYANHLLCRERTI